MKFGTAAMTCADAMVETGPLGLCGATGTLKASASDAIFRISEIPPQRVMSGIRKSTASCSRSARAWKRE